MVSQKEVDFMSMEIDAWKQQTATLVKLVNTTESKYEARGKSLNKLWERGKELQKEVATLQKFCGRITLNLAKLELENRIIVIPANKQIGCEPKQFLVRDIVRQLINVTGYDLEFNVLQKKFFGPVNLAMTGEEIKK